MPGGLSGWGLLVAVSVQTACTVTTNGLYSYNKRLVLSLQTACSVTDKQHARIASAPSGFSNGGERLTTNPFPKGGGVVGRMKVASVPANFMSHPFTYSLGIWREISQKGVNLRLEISQKGVKTWIMRRKIYQKLLDWKRQRKGDVALLIEGARRIGKSYIVEEFAKNEYDSYLLVDFSKVNPQVMELFRLYLDDLDTLFLNLEVYYRKKLSPRASSGDEAHSLIIFDEVQFCPHARAAIKHLVADRRYDYIETGSLISIKKNVKDIMVPSEEHSIEMFPMDFEEFLWAMGDEVMMPYIRQQFEQRQPMGMLHRKALDYFRQYMIVGGMPQAVAKYVSTRDFEQVDEVKRDILSLYRNDINKYADNHEVKVASIFEEIPGQLQKHERKFRLSSLQTGAKMRDYADSFFWLSDARIINCCYNATEPNIGLRMNEERTSLKCYMGDTGLLISLAFDERGIVGEDLYRKLMLDKLEVNEGMLVENIVAQMLRTAGHRLYFYSRSAAESADRMEIDFLIAKAKTTSRHNISPIEVKSGKAYTLTSLKKCIAKYPSYLSTPYVLHDKDMKEADGIVYLPLYMTPLL